MDKGSSYPHAILRCLGSCYCDHRCVKVWMAVCFNHPRPHDDGDPATAVRLFIGRHTDMGHRLTSTHNFLSGLIPAGNGYSFLFDPLTNTW